MLYENINRFAAALAKILPSYVSADEGEERYEDRVQEIDSRTTESIIRDEATREVEDVYGDLSSTLKTNIVETATALAVELIPVEDEGEYDWSEDEHYEDEDEYSITDRAEHLLNRLETLINRAESLVNRA